MSTKPKKSSPEQLEAAARAIREFWKSGSELEAPARARRFHRSWSEADVTELIDRARRHEWALGTAAITAILSVPPKERGKVVTEILRDRLTLAQVRQLVAMKYGPRRQGGRPRRVAPTTEGILVELERLSEGFLRYREALRRPAEEGKGPLDQALPPEVLKALDAAVKKIKTLQAAVEAELRARVPTRIDAPRNTRPIEAPARSLRPGSRG